MRISRFGSTDCYKADPAWKDHVCGKQTTQDLRYPSVPVRKENEENEPRVFFL